MLTGKPYHAGNTELVKDRQRAQTLLQIYNALAPGQNARKAAILNLLLNITGTPPEITAPFYCDYGYNITLGDSFYSNFNCTILDCAPVTIGSHVLLGPNVQIYTATHPLNPEERKKGLESALPVTIGSHVWIGGGAIITPGVTIGEGATIGAGSIVTHDIPARVIAAGNPCRIIRTLD